MGLARLDIYDRYTMGGIVCRHTWVFRVLLPLYFNSNGLVYVKTKLETAKYLYSEDLTFWDFLGGDFRRFPKDFIEFVEKQLGILTENVAMVLIRVLPKRV